MKLAIGRGLMTQPRLMLLDEPSLGLSPRVLGLIFDRLAELKAVGMTMLIVEQNAVESLALSNRGYVLELGRNRFEGPGPALLADPEVKRLYLGGRLARIRRRSRGSRLSNPGGRRSSIG